MEQLLAVIDQNNTAGSNHEPGFNHKPRSILPGLYSDPDLDEDDNDSIVEPGQDAHILPMSPPMIVCRPSPKSSEPGPALIDEAGEQYYTVAAIVDSRVRNRRFEYFIDWEGYGPEHRSWEPASELKQHTSIREMIEYYHDDHPDRPKPGARRKRRRSS